MTVSRPGPWGALTLDPKLRPMGDIVNLNKYRKKRQISEKKQKSAANRVQFGRLKADRDVAAAQKAKHNKELDLKQLEPIPFVRPQADTADDDPSDPS